MASPAVVGTPTETAVVTASTTHTVNLPAGASGSLLIAVMSKGSAGTTPSVDAKPAGQSCSTRHRRLASISPTGLRTEPRVQRTIGRCRRRRRGAWIVYEISGAIAPVTRRHRSGRPRPADVEPNPPSVSVTGGSKDILAIAMFGRAGEEADDDTWVTAAPSGFGGLLQKACGHDRREPGWDGRDRASRGDDRDRESGDVHGRNGCVAGADDRGAPVT